MDVAGNTADEGVDSMCVGILFPFGHVVGVAYLMGNSWTPPADFTPTLDPGHPESLPIVNIIALRARKILLNAP